MKRILTESFVLLLIAVAVALPVNLIRDTGIPLFPETISTEQNGEVVKIPSFIQNEEKDSTEIISMFHQPVEIDLQKAYKFYLDGKVLFMDARDPEEYSTGHIKGAVNVPYNDLASFTSYIRSLKKDTTIVTYCDGEECNMSTELAYQLYDIGFSDVYYFFGGWEKWKGSGYPVESGTERKK